MISLQIISLTETSTINNTMLSLDFTSISHRGLSLGATVHAGFTFCRKSLFITPKVSVGMPPFSLHSSVQQKLFYLFFCPFLWESTVIHGGRVFFLSCSGIVQQMRNLLKGVAATSASIVLHSRRHECHVLLFQWVAIVYLSQTAMWWDGTSWWSWRPAVEAAGIKLLHSGLAGGWPFVLWIDPTTSVCYPRPVSVLSGVYWGIIALESICTISGIHDFTVNAIFTKPAHIC